MKPNKREHDWRNAVDFFKNISSLNRKGNEERNVHNEFQIPSHLSKNIKRGINKGKGGGEQTTARLLELTVHIFSSNL
jgi:hypothetical protein